MTILLIGLLAVVLTAVVVLPLVAPSLADPLPDDRDPLALDLEEERDALLNAIRELDARDDLAAERRDELRARYEAKAARVLRALDERRAELGGRSPRQARPAPRRAPWGAIGLVVASAGIAATLGGWVLPRVGQDATVTTFDDAAIAAGERIRDLRRTAEAAPSADAWTALGDAYWAAEDADGATEAYRAAVDAFPDAAPARAWQRLGLLTLSQDVAEAQRLLEEARARDPDDPNTLGTLAELYFQGGAYPASLDAFEALARTPAAGDDPVVQDRVALLRDLVPLAETAQAEPTTATLLALGETLWNADARSAAASAYFRVLTDFDADDPTALARVGELLFLDGRSGDAVALLSRARASADARGERLPPNALLFLGNAAFTEEDWDLAIDAWQAHLDVADDPGRVPGLIEQARARRDGDTAGAGEPSLPLPGVPGTAGPNAGPNAGAGAGGGAVEASAEGAALYQANCAACHGPAGAGGSGPRLAGNRNAGRAANVENLIRFGRGMMPGFAGSLSDAEVETLRDWVVATFAP